MRLRLGHRSGMSYAAAVAVVELLIAVGCGPAATTKPGSDLELELAAGSAYAAEHQRCIAKFSTDPEIDACRAQVRAKWGITTTSTRFRDGGTDR